MSEAELSAHGMSLAARLAEATPEGVKLVYHHLSTPPTKCDPLFAPPAGRKAQRTCRESHLLAISSPPERAGTVGPFIFAIEVFIYTTKNRTILFVSKADSTGCQLGVSKAAGTSPLRAAATTFVDWLVDERQRSGIPCIISLFARAQNQYLFPGSESNAGKHILDDRQLVRWWCKTLDPIVRRRSKKDGSSQALLKQLKQRQGYLIVPGFDRHETTHFFPETWRADSVDEKVWKYGHPLYEISPYPAAAPRCMVPRFPDDPKTRYLDDLDAEIPDRSSAEHKSSPSKRSGRWKSINTLETFWDTMAYRQECRSGRLVGFVWIVIRPDQPATDTTRQPLLSKTQDTESTIRASMTASFSSTDTSTTVTATQKSNRNKQRRPLTGPIVARQPRIKTIETSNPTQLPESSLYYRWPATSRGQVVLSQASYDRLHELLIKLDFTSNEAARASTAKWLDEIRSISAPVGEWGTLIIGQAQAILARETSGAAAADPVGKVTDLSSSLVRKKRPREDPEVARAGPNMLGTGLVRKKQKIPVQ